MKSLRIYCGARDQDVSVAVLEAPSHDGQANLMDEEIVCLEVNRRCSGGMCPLGTESPSAFVARMAREGLLDERLITGVAFCEPCARATEFVLFDDGQAVCTVCGAASLLATPRCEQMTSE